VPKIETEWRHGKFSQFTGGGCRMEAGQLQKFLGGKSRFWGDLQAKLHSMTRPRHVCAKSSELALIIEETQALNLPKNILGWKYPFQPFPRKSQGISTVASSSRPCCCIFWNLDQGLLIWTPTLTISILDASCNVKRIKSRVPS
jgi:hypothetical protein